MYDCSNCSVWKYKKEKLLNKSDSVFDATSDLSLFITECRKTCEKYKEDKLKKLK